VGIWTDSIRNGEFHLANTNKLIRFYQGATGLKTGSTDSAGFCISASAERDGMELIAVVLGSKTSVERFEGAKSLLNYGFGAYTLVDAAPQQPFPPVAVALGAQDSVNVEQKESCRLLVKREQADQVTTQVQLPERVDAPIEAGQPLGRLVISVGEEQRRTLPLNAVEDVPRLTLWQIFGRLCSAVTGT
jgi:D-alanyl-D-alanine carboxypeptidase (penicillin-binding protein 5/6)